MRDASSSKKRSDARQPFYCPVEITWQARTGETKKMKGDCLDLSAQGARIQCKEPLEVQSTVSVRAPGRGLMGNASVRYCLRTGLGYIVGVAFQAAASQADEGRKRCLRESGASVQRTPVA